MAVRGPDHSSGIAAERANLTEDDLPVTTTRTSTVLIRYFAGARAAAGVAEEHIELASAGSVADALAVVLRRRGAELARMLPSCSVLLDGGRGARPWRRGARRRRVGRPAALRGWLTIRPNRTSRFASDRVSILANG